MAGSDDEDSALDPSEQTNRPNDSAFNQQRVKAWHPVLDPIWVTVALLYLGIIMVPVGFKIDSMQKNVVEMKVTYDDYYDDNPICGIGDNFNADRVCNLTFVAPKDMSPPILVHYQLVNFHQNHRNYYESRDPYQLLGRVGNQDSVSAESCKVLNKLGNITLNPCGLTANTFFNDKFELVQGRDAFNVPLQMIETGIAWGSDIKYMYAQPDTFNSSVCPDNVCDASCCEGSEWSCTTPYIAPNGTCYRYYYPEDDTTQYLYETYPNIISPLEGVTNEHFIVWMRIATQATFQKLYGWINQPINAGETLVFQVHANYVVTRFRGAKSLIVGTNTIFGGRNQFLPPVFVGVGGFCLVMGVFFALKQALRPRKLADPDYLLFKDD